MALSRRDFVRSGVAAGALLIGNPFRAIGAPDHYGTSRASRLFPGRFLVHADLHNHTLYSDADGDAMVAFESMRNAGLDVAALTDHSTLSFGLPDSACPGRQKDCQGLAGIDEETWERTRQIADQQNAPNAFVSLRGFEWSSPSLGHINVWFTERWIDPLHTAGVGNGQNAGDFAHRESGENIPQEITDPLDAIINGVPLGSVSMDPFYEWMNPPLPIPESGLGGIAGFNHPGREPSRFANFAYNALVQQQMVSMEIFNRREDYLFEGTDTGLDSPLVQCLDAGWRTGLLGVTDEHGTDWGYPDGKGRGGLWVSQLTRDGVKEAMQSRRFFATNLKGLRVDASANGVQMGQGLSHLSGPVHFELDLDRGPAWYGKALQVQVLRPGNPLPTVADNVLVSVPTPEQPVIGFGTNLDIADGGWVVLRISDASLPADGRATGQWTGFGHAVAYSSPWWLQV